MCLKFAVQSVVYITHSLLDLCGCARMKGCCLGRVQHPFGRADLKLIRSECYNELKDPFIATSLCKVMRAQDSV